MAEVTLHPLLQALRGKVNGLVFRLSHNGKISVYETPDMSRVKASPAQEQHSEKMAAANAYSKAARADPELRLHYERMSMELKGNKRPHDMAVMDYFAGNNLLGDRFHWDSKKWHFKRQLNKKRKKR